MQPVRTKPESFKQKITHNIATIILLMPILAPSAMSTSCVFMLPVAAASNAIIFGCGHVAITRMALNFIGVVVITFVCYFLMV